jgi:hypothetical protein
MADDKMKNDDLDRNLGGTEKQGGQQAPGRQPQQDDEKFGQRGGGTAPGRGLDENDETGQGGRGGNIGNKPGGGQGGQNR